MIVLKFLKLLILINFINLYKANIIVFSSPEQVKDINTTVELNCTIAKNVTYDVMWVKKYRDRPFDQIPLTRGQEFFFKDQRYEMIYENETNSYVLKIKNIIEDDTGIYGCNVMDGQKPTIKASAHVELLVRYPSRIINNETSKSITSVEGETITLQCQTEGYPRPTITWHREYNAILPSGGHLAQGANYKISKLNKKDRGTYICRAENGVGKPDTANFNVEVEFPPAITVPRPKIAQALNYNILLECLVEAYPAPSIVWKRNNNQIHTGPDYTISHVASENEITRSTVEVISLNSNKYGDYHCEASNKMGSAESRINLFESVLHVRM